MTLIPREVRETVMERALRRCEYCCLPDRFQAGGFELDHIFPKSRGGVSTEDNLAYACPHCNDHKWAHVDASDPVTERIVLLFHPRKDRWDDHFEWSLSTSLKIIGKTSVGRATVQRLQLNHAELLQIRQGLTGLGVAITHPESQAED